MEGAGPVSRDMVIVLIGLLAGLGIGWILWRPAAPTPELHARAIELKGGGLVLEREPEAPIPAPIKAAVKELGNGAKLERVVRIKVQSKASVVDSTPCPSVNLDLGIVKMPDDTHRVIATTPDGEIVGGVDIPIQATVPVKSLKWAAGALYAPQEEAYGAFLDRDVGPLRLGAEVMQSRDHGLTGIIRFGIRF